MKSWIVLAALVGGIVGARAASADKGDAALAALTEQVRDLENLSADKIVELEGGESSRLYRRVDKLVKGIAEVGGPRAAALLDRLSKTPAVTEITNIASGNSKRVLIDAYIAVGEPVRGLPLVRALLSNTNPQRAWHGTELQLQFDQESRLVVRVLAKLRQAALAHGEHALAKPEEAELAKLWTVASRAPGDASRVVHGIASNEPGFPKLMPQADPASFRRVAAGARRVEREITRWRTSMNLARGR